jgi:hypothetical protein
MKRRPTRPLPVLLAERPDLTDTDWIGVALHAAEMEGC